MKKILKLWLTIWLFQVALYAKADLLSATLLYNEGNYQQAYQEFYRLAKLGHKDAIYNLGVIYLHGQGVETDLAKAHAWFQLAADFGLYEAKAAALLIAQKVADEEEITAAYQTLTEQISYQNFRETLLPEFNEQQFVQQIHQPPQRLHTVDAKYPQSAYEKGIEGWVWLEFDVDESGAVKDVDIIDAYPNKTFNRAILNAVRRWRYEPYTIEGKAQPYHSRSLLYHFTTFKGERYQASFNRQKKEYQQKINQLVEGAEQGNAVVQYYIANWLNTEEHNATRLLRFHWQQKTAGSELLLESAINGYPNSQYRLGTSLLRGEYTQADRKKGMNWILNAAQSGFVYAQYRLAREMLDQRYLEFDADKALRWMLAAAEQGHFRAMRDLVLLLIEQQQFEQANHWLTKAMSIDDEHPDLLWYQSQLLLKTKQKTQAKKVLLQAIKQAKSREWFSQSLVNFQQQHFAQ